MREHGQGGPAVPGSPAPHLVLVESGEAFGSQIACKPTGSVQVAKPLDNSVNAIPALAACRFAHSWPLTQIFIGYGK